MEKGVMGYQRLDTLAQEGSSTCSLKTDCLMILHLRGALLSTPSYESTSRGSLRGAALSTPSYESTSPGLLRHAHY